MLSENGKFIARVMPGRKNLKPLLIVSSIDDARTNEIWKAELSNLVSPTEVRVADDGESVVTLDNYFGVGYGDDVIAIYGRSGQLAKFSLEQIAPLPTSNPNRRASSPDRRAYRGKFSHSVSSRHWRQKSIEFFINDEGQLFFGLWLDWEARWVAWRMTDGQLITVTSEQSRRFNDEGRRRALEQAKSGSFASAAFHFLGHFRFEEDRPLIEAWLRDTEFSSGASFPSGNAESAFTFAAESHKRETADALLTRWDGKESGDVGSGSLHRYQFLGTLKCAVTFTTAPAKNEGSIRLYLIPESTPLSEWASTRPAQFLIADLRQPYAFYRGRSRNRNLSKVVNFVIYGVTPGRYRSKVVWDKVAPFAKEREIVCRPSPGDYESTDSPLISVREGVATEIVNLECNKLVAR